jgi:thioredoxin 1
VKGNATNAVVSGVVIVVIAGVAWFRSVHEGSSTGTLTPPAPTAANPAPGTTTAPVQKGELGPEPPPAAQAAAAATSRPATPATSQPVARKLPRVVDLGADKCIPCKKLAPILEELKKEYEGRVIVEVIDVWKTPKAGEPYKIRVIPTQIFFDADGKEVWRHEGFLPKADFVAKFKELGVK